MQELKRKAQDASTALEKEKEKNRRHVHEVENVTKARNQVEERLESYKGEVRELKGHITEYEKERYRRDSATVMEDEDVVLGNRSLR